MYIYTILVYFLTNSFVPKMQTLQFVQAVSQTGIVEVLQKIVWVLTEIGPAELVEGFKASGGSASRDYFKYKCIYQTSRVNSAINIMFSYYNFP